MSDLKFDTVESIYGNFDVVELDVYGRGGMKAAVYDDGFTVEFSMQEHSGRMTGSEALAAIANFRAFLDAAEKAIQEKRQL